ncbi:MAG TPA: tRNA (N(6)-L-threonylcarbamoyladenosine(37)-C(2))-methylthiotransferase MtaB [Stellaceae bacterium]
MPLDIVTFGCRLNAFESEAIRRHAEAAGLDDAIIVNTCAVTSEAERQARQAIRKLRREHPSARLIVTGCAAQIDPARFAAMPEVDTVLGNAEKMRAESYRDLRAGVSAGDIFSVHETASHLVEGFDGRARAIVQVQQGCDHRCTFCIIPYGRGASRSVPAAGVIAQARLLVERGYRELVLTGVDVTSYRPSLGALCRDLLDAVPDLPRLRLTSLDPAEIDDDLWALIADEPRLMPHLHLSLQAGDDLILKRMKRRHSRAQALTVAARARDLRPGIALGADLIAGFPTESDDAFANTLAAVEEMSLDYLHVFPFSPRPGTPASRMPQVKGDTVRARAARLREAGTAALAKSLAGRVGSIAQVLIERDGVGRTEHYAPVRFVGAHASGSVVPMRLASSDGAHLVAVPA